jgi:hypothetical protein
MVARAAAPLSVPRDDRVPAVVAASFRDAWLASKLGRDVTAAAARVAR